jgi:TRAP-type mannitol/chloroaromatic compound transport system permease large subunit
MLIVYGATAGVSVVQLYAGAFFPGLMLAGLYVVYVVLLAKLKPHLMPPLSAQDRFVPLPPLTQKISETVSNTALPALLKALKGQRNVNVPTGYLVRQLGVALMPAAFFLLALTGSWHLNTRPVEAQAVAAISSGGVSEPAGAAQEAGVAGASGGSSGGVQEPPGADAGGVKEPPGSGSDGVKEPPGADSGVKEPPGAGSGVKEPPGADTGVKEPPGSESGGVREPPGASQGVQEPPGAAATAGGAGAPVPQAEAARTPPTAGWWIGAGVGALAMVAFYAILSFQRLEIFKMLLGSFFPLLVLILAVLGSIVFGLATPTEAAAVGAFGGFVLAVAYKQFNLTMLKESVFLTAKTSAMVCWLFVGSAIFSAAFALLGGQELVENWVMSLNLTKTEFLILSQVIIFILGWPLEWTEIIVIFMPIFIPLLDNFGVDPLFFGLLVALNLQTAFLSPPVAMAAFYLKGVSPPHVTLNQIFAGMLPFMGIQIIAIILLYNFPGIGMWLPEVLYR